MRRQPSWFYRHREKSFLRTQCRVSKDRQQWRGPPLRSPCRSTWPGVDAFRDAVGHPGVDDGGVGGIDRDRVDDGCTQAHIDGRPRGPGVEAFEHAAAVGPSVEDGRVRRIDRKRLDIEVGQAGVDLRPGRAAVGRLTKTPARVSAGVDCGIGALASTIRASTVSLARATSLMSAQVEPPSIERWTPPLSAPA